VIVFRCDANSATGLGHLSRCISLAEAFEDLGYESLFVGNFEGAGQAFLKTAGFSFEQCPGWSVEDARAVVRRFENSQCNLVVLDSYALNDAYLDALGRVAERTVVVDDYGKLERYNCSGILNFTVEAENVQYPDGPKLMLGPDYMLTRRRFVEYRKSKSVHIPPRNVLVTFGGIDRHGATEKVVKMFLDHTQLHVRAIVSDFYSNMAELEALASSSDGLFEIQCQQPDLAEAFGWADVAVTAGGLSKYEAAYMGVPVLVFSQSSEEVQESGRFARHALCVDGGSGERLERDGDQVLFDFLKGTGGLEGMVRAMKNAFTVDSTQNAARKMLQIAGGDIRV